MDFGGGATRKKINNIPKCPVDSTAVTHVRNDFRRNTAWENEKMKKSRSGKKISLHPDDLYKSPRTRNSVVTCLAFGENRKTRYPEYFFCHACDLFEDAVRNGNKRAKRTQPKYVCTGGHKVDSGRPTALRGDFRRRSRNDSIVLVGDEKEVTLNKKNTLGDVVTTTKTLQSEEDTPSKASPLAVKSPVKKKFVELEVPPSMQHQIQGLFEASKKTVDKEKEVFAHMVILIIESSTTKTR